MSTHFLQIEPTTKCNFTCGYCYGRSMPQQHMSMDTFRQILQRFPDATHVHLQGEGEPLLNPHFFEMADVCRSRGIDVSSVTNGSIITEKFAREFVRLQFSRVSISLDSADPTVFQHIRGGTLSSVVKGVTTLMEAVRAAGVDRPRVGLSVTLLKSTIDTLDAVVDLYERLGLNGGMNVQPLQRMSAYLGVYNQWLHDELMNEDEQKQLRRQMLARPRLRRVVYEMSGGEGFFEKMFEGWDYRTPVCPWLEKGVYVNHAGHVTGCCQIKDHRQFGFGNAGTDSRDDIEQRRDQLNRELSSGVCPPACEGCGLATLVVEHQRPGTTRRERQANLIQIQTRGKPTRLRSDANSGATAG